MTAISLVRLLWTKRYWFNIIIGICLVICIHFKSIDVEYIPHNNTNNIIGDDGDDDDLDDDDDDDDDDDNNNNNN